MGMGLFVTSQQIALTLSLCLLIFSPNLVFWIVSFYGRLAQLVEHSTFNRTVVGSNPTAPTTLTLKASIFISNP